ncbi:hypothetical protein DFH08DRAFT_937668, partial [Mycena albidolilacea]
MFLVVWVELFVHLNSSICTHQGLLVDADIPGPALLRIALDGLPGARSLKWNLKRRNELSLGGVPIRPATSKSAGAIRNEWRAIQRRLPSIIVQLLLFSHTAVAARINYLAISFRQYPSLLLTLQSRITPHSTMADEGCQQTRISALENCHDFIIKGGTFSFSAAEDRLQSDFRVVKLDDLNLLDEIGKYNVVERRAIHHKRTGIVDRHIEVIIGTQRIYRARIFG